MDQLAFICQVVDDRDPILASVAEWVKNFARHPRVGKMVVFTLKTGFFDSPPNVEVVVFRGKNHLATTVNFYREVGKRLRNIDYFFVHMGGPYPIWLLPFKLLMNKPIYQWKTHPHIKLEMKISARFCDTKVFTATASSFPMPLSKVKIVGHGIDVRKFSAKNFPKTGELIAVGRVAPVKQFESAIELLHYCQREHRVTYQLDIYGPVLEKDEPYRRKLCQLIADRGLSDQVFFRGVVAHDQMPDLLSQYRVCLSFNKGALDKSVLEAMACCLPVVTPNRCVAEILPRDLQELLIVPETDLAKQADQLVRLLMMNKVDSSVLGCRLRQIVENGHNIDQLVNKIVGEINVRH